MQLIDKLLPDYTYREYHKILVKAAEKKCFSAAKNLDLKKSLISVMLFKMRGLPTQDLTMQGFLKNMNFTYLAENEPHEFVINASRPGLKIIWNFYFKETQKNKTLVSTETRILCLTNRSKLIFSIYWFFVRPFSGITRIEMLRLIRRKAESI